MEYVGGYSAESVRSDNGYVHRVGRLTSWPSALDRLAEAVIDMRPSRLFPPPPKQHKADKGFVKGNRTDHLNKVVFTDEMRGQTDHSKVTGEAIAKGMPAGKVTKANKKTIADADAAKARTFPRKDADALEGSLEALGYTARFNIRAMCPEMSNGGGKWTRTTDRSSADLRRRIAERFSIQVVRR